jgi:hypothetical protein
MLMRSIDTLAQQLVRASLVKEFNPQLGLNWPAIDSLPENAWYFSPELSTLYGLPQFADLPLEQQQKLSFFEAVNFFSLNIHGEKKLLQGMTERLYGRWPKDISAYLHHFVGEENKHMSVFGRFCMDYAGKVYPSKHVAVERDYAPGELDFLFFARVVIFEEFVDYFNQAMAKDERLVPIAQQINAYHHSEEVRHLAFGRKFCQQLLHDHWDSWSPSTQLGIRQYLAAYREATWKEYYNPQVYKDAGIANAYDVYLMAWDHPTQQAFRARVSAGTLAFLESLDLVTELA